jgi:subtilisin
MKLRPCLTLLVTLMVFCQPELRAAATDQDVSAIESESSDSEAQTEFNRLSTKAIDEGSVQVMVVLKEQPDAFGLPQSLRQQDGEQTQIESQQDALMADVPIHRKNTIKRFSHLPFLGLSADADELKRLRASPQVAEIIEDKMNFPLSHEISIAKIGADAGWGLGYTGAGQTVAILDNGVDKNHPLLVNKVVKEACFSTANKKQKVKSSCRKNRKKDLKVGSASVTCGFQNFDCSHGTLLAGLTAGKSSAANLAGSGAAPQASIIAVKVDSLIKNKKICGSARPCSVFFDSDLLRGLEFVYKQRRAFNIASINVSVGGKSSKKGCLKSPIRRTVARLRKANIATIAASGNEGAANRLSSPACIPGVISVGATNTADTVLSYSNSASVLSLLAPGDKIGLPMPGVVSAGFEVVSSGTSLSSSFVSGAWAALKQHKPTATVDEILGALVNTGVPIADPKNGLVKPRIQVNQAHAAITP